NTKFDGVSFTRSFFSSYSARPAILPISWKLFGSASFVMRSRIVSRPPSYCRLTRSGPPSSSANASRRRRSSISRSQLMEAPAEGPDSFRARSVGGWGARRGPPMCFGHGVALRARAVRFGAVELLVRARDGILAVVGDVLHALMELRAALLAVPREAIVFTAAALALADEHERP